MRGRLVEVAFAVCVATLAAGALIAVPLPVSLLACLGALVSGAIVAARAGRYALRTAIWRLRNRLIVAYVFIAVIPILLVLVFARYGSRYAGEQVSVQLVQQELDRRVKALEGAASTIAQAPPERREASLDRIQTFLQQRYPGVQVLAGVAEGPNGKANSGIASRDGLIYAWGRAQARESRVTVTAPVTRRWLASLIPGIGDVTLLDGDGSGRFRLHETGGDDLAGAPPAVNRFDTELLWAAPVDVAAWDQSSRGGQALLSVRSRLSAVIGVLVMNKTDSPLLDLLKVFGVLFLVVQAVSIVIGVTLTRTITGAVSELYEGTRHVSGGDFSHRIRIAGGDQLAELGKSFNGMTAHIESLIQVAKEKERMEAELDIARQVQSQLFPKTIPSSGSLCLTAVCHPARSVSGDYYDFQELPGGRIALALGDVAGKGISAALLMASLQASLRSQLREAADWPGACVIPSRLVGRLNQHLHANTSAEKYATFFFAVYDDESSTLTYTNAGHLPPLLIRDGKAAPLEVTGTVVGAFAQARYEECTLRLEPGDLLIAYTDGVSEPENEFGEMFGDHRLAELLVQSAALEPGRIAEAVTEAVRGFTGSGELQDDLTLLIARRS